MDQPKGQLAELTKSISYLEPSGIIICYSDRKYGGFLDLEQNLESFSSIKWVGEHSSLLPELIELIRNESLYYIKP